MRRAASLLPLLLILAGAASAQDAERGNFGVSTHEIFVKENESPDASTYGIDPKLARPDVVGWRGSNPETLKSLLAGLDQPLAWPSARTAAVMLLSAPVLPDATEAVPSNWLLLRLEALNRIGEYDAAWKLYKSLPRSFLTEPIARLGAQSAWSSGQVRPACDLTTDLIKDTTTSFPNDQSKIYWLSHFTICQKLSGQGEQADLTLQLLKETAFRKLPPMLAPLLEDWGSARPLPALRPEDLPLQPALSALLGDPTAGDGVAGRVSGNFAGGVTVIPPLMAALSRIPAIDPVSRAHFGEEGVRYHLLPAEQLTRHYTEIAGRDGGRYADATRRARLYMNAAASRAPAVRAMATAEALAQYHAVFSALDARAILADPMLRSVGLLGDQAPPSLILETLGLHIDRAARGQAWSLAQSLGQYPSAASTLTADVALHVLRLKDEPTRRTREAIFLPDLTPPQPPEVIWLAARYAKVMEVLGYDVRRPARDFQFDAPPPDIAYPAPEQLQAMQVSVARGLYGEAMLRSIGLLGPTPPERTSDAVIGQVLQFWHQQRLDTLAADLAIDALTGVPDARRTAPYSAGYGQ